MSLATCPDCRSPVSMQAPSCPRCGRPFQQQPRGRTQTVEQTGKGWKGLQVLAVIGFGYGLFKAFSSETDEGMAQGVFVVVLCVVAAIFARVGAWWFHG